MDPEEAVPILGRAMQVEYGLILSYPELAKLMPDMETADEFRKLGEASARHAQTVAQLLVSLGAEAPPPAPVVPREPSNWRSVLLAQLEYEKLARWSYSTLAGVAGAEMGARLRAMAEEEEAHIRVVEALLDRFAARPM